MVDSRTLTTNDIFKTCSQCGKEKPATSEYFYRLKDGLRACCKDCLKQYREKNKELIKKQHERYYKENLETVKSNIKQYHIDNAERIREYKALYRSKNNEKIKEKEKEFYINNSEKLKEKVKNYRKNNVEKVRLQQKKYALQNKEKISEYRRKYSKAHPEKNILHSQKRRTLKRKLLAYYSSEQWESVKNIFSNKCAYCGKESKLTQDHFIPLTKGGEYTINNIIPTCTSCNSSKGNKDFFEWYQQQGFYSKKREQKILKYLNYNKDRLQQLSIIV